jgi:Arm DNA-binding domain
MRLTELTIKTLKLPPLAESKQKTFFDDSIKGFGVRVSVGGTKSFVLMYGKQRKLETIGRYPEISLAEARTRARKHLGVVVDEKGVMAGARRCP